MHVLPIAALAILGQADWRPAHDNPLFSPLRRSDPHPARAPMCWVSDSRGRELTEFGEQDEPLLVRIQGRLATFHFNAAESEADVELNFDGAEGRITIRFGREIASAHEYSASRGTLTLVDQVGHSAAASVTVECGS